MCLIAYLNTLFKSFKISNSISSLFKGFSSTSFSTSFSTSLALLIRTLMTFKLYYTYSFKLYSLVYFITTLLFSFIFFS